MAWVCSGGQEERGVGGEWGIRATGGAHPFPVRGGGARYWLRSAQYEEPGARGRAHSLRAMSDASARSSAEPRRSGPARARRGRAADRPVRADDGGQLPEPGHERAGGLRAVRPPTCRPTAIGCWPPGSARRCELVARAALRRARSSTTCARSGSSPTTSSTTWRRSASRATSTRSRRARSASPNEPLLRVTGAADRGAAARDAAAQPDQLPDHDRHQGRPRRARRRRRRAGRRRARGRLLAAARPRHRRRDEGRPLGRGRGLRRHLERGRGDALRAAAGGDHGPLLRPLVRQRGGGVPRVHRGLPRAAPILLVDTYDTLEGVRHAIAAAATAGVAAGGRAARLRRPARALARGAAAARRGRDDETRIAASGDLEEDQIAALVAAGAPIDLWGVGTDLGTSRDSPVVNGVYKLVADRRGEQLARRLEALRRTRRRCRARSRCSAASRRGRDGRRRDRARSTRSSRASRCWCRRCAAASSCATSRWRQIRERSAAQLAALPERLRRPARDRGVEPYPVELLGAPARASCDSRRAAKKAFRSAADSSASEARRPPRGGG